MLDFFLDCYLWSVVDNEVPEHQVPFIPLLPGMLWCVSYVCVMYALCVHGCAVEAGGWCHSPPYLLRQCLTNGLDWLPPSPGASLLPSAGRLSRRGALSPACGPYSSSASGS